MKNERIIHGIACGQVIAELSDYLDGELAKERRAALEAHVRECELCTRFGGAFATTLQSLRQRLTSEPVPDAVAARLAEALRRARQ